ncbi:hypothetical protein DMENIID0001_164920 [Sergentomyia squamirostris]
MKKHENSYTFVPFGQFIYASAMLSFCQGKRTKEGGNLSEKTFSLSSMCCTTLCVRKRYLIGGSRRRSQLLAGVLTGHCLKKHLNRIGVSHETLCRGCEETEETVEHYVCDCPSLCGIRRTALGEPVLSPRELSRIDTASLMEFIRITGWLDQ